MIDIDKERFPKISTSWYEPKSGRILDLEEVIVDHNGDRIALKLAYRNNTGYRYMPLQMFHDQIYLKGLEEYEHLQDTQ